CVRVIQRADFRRNLELDGSSRRNAGQEVDADTELAEGNADRVAAQPRLNHGEGELAAGDETGFFAVDRQEVWLGERFQHALAFQRLDGRCQVDVSPE